MHSCITSLHLFSSTCICCSHFTFLDQFLNNIIEKINKNRLHVHQNALKIEWLAESIWEEGHDDKPGIYLEKIIITPCSILHFDDSPVYQHNYKSDLNMTIYGHVVRESLFMMVFPRYFSADQNLCWFNIMQSHTIKRGVQMYFST